MDSQQKSGVAAVLSFIIPGLGQIFRGQIMEGLFWLLFTVAGYVLFIVPGVVMHVLCMVKAYNPNAKLDKNLW